MQGFAYGRIKCYEKARYFEDRRRMPNNTSSSIIGVTNPTNSRATVGRNPHLDAVRALAATAVVLEHAQGLFFLPYARSVHGPMITLFYLIHFIGRPAVMIFFVLSGYLVGTSALRAQRLGKFSWSNYLLSRTTRLYVVLLPALLMTALIDGLGRWTLKTRPLYLTLWENSPDHTIASLDTFPIFLGNLLFLQNILVPPFGSDGSVWSLPNEFWYYMLFPTIALIFFGHSRRLIHLSVAAGIAILCYGPILMLFFVWIAGVCVGWAAENRPIQTRIARRIIVSTSLVAIALAIFAQTLHRIGGFALDFAFTLPASLLLWALLSAPPRSENAYAKTAIFFSEMSYSLYLTHLPLITMLFVLMTRGEQWPVDTRHVLLFLVPVGASFVFAYITYWLFESRTDIVRRWIKSHLVDCNN